MKAKLILKSFSELPTVEVFEAKTSAPSLVSCDGNIWPADPAEQCFVKSRAGQWSASTREIAGCPGTE